MGIEFIISNNTIVLGQRKEQSRALARPRGLDRRGGTARRSEGPALRVVPARQSRLRHPGAGSGAQQRRSTQSGQRWGGPLSAVFTLLFLGLQRPLVSSRHPGRAWQGVAQWPWLLAPRSRGPGRAPPLQSSEHTASPPGPLLRISPLAFMLASQERTPRLLGGVTEYCVLQYTRKVWAFCRHCHPGTLPTTGAGARYSSKVLLRSLPPSALSITGLLFRS